MPDTVRRWTREEVLALPDDGNRYELIDGELLVTPSPRGIHQRGVLSLYDRITKRHRYQRSWVAEYWIVDLDARVVERRRPADERPEVLAVSLQWESGGAPTPLEIDLVAYVREVWDEEQT
jgi:Uma2 family endonuclease